MGFGCQVIAGGGVVASPSSGRNVVRAVHVYSAPWLGRGGGIGVCAPAHALDTLRHNSLRGDRDAAKKSSSIHRQLVVVLWSQWLGWM